MDYLALLCTLHADGPETLQRLRTSGCRTLTEVAEFPPSELQLVLGRDRDDALRFQREALHLRSRVETNPTANEEPVPAPDPRPAPRPVPEIVDLPPVEAPPAQPEARTEPEPFAGVTNEGEDRAVGPAGGRTPLQVLLDVLGPGGTSVAAAPTAPEVAPGTPVEALLVHDVDPGMVQRLRDSGFPTLEHLLDHQTRQNAQRASVTYTQMLRLQFRARLALRQRA